VVAAPPGEAEQSKRINPKKMALRCRLIAESFVQFPHCIVHACKRAVVKKLQVSGMRHEQSVKTFRIAIIESNRNPMKSHLQEKLTMGGRHAIRIS
jgi:hypothetical protein